VASILTELGRMHTKRPAHECVESSGNLLVSDGASSEAWNFTKYSTQSPKESVKWKRRSKRASTQHTHAPMSG
jgi:hypothetical protein